MLTSWKKMYRHMYAIFLCVPMIAMGKGNPVPTATALIFEWKGKVRVSQCGCLGLCQKGPNVILYPQKIWFSGVLESDAPGIISEIESIVTGGSSGI
jgi:(2Fe-2S) ferredoxin